MPCGSGKSGCTRCRCSCERRRGPPCAAAKQSGSGNASRTADRRWPCRILRSKEDDRSGHPVHPARPVPHLVGCRIYRFTPACIYCGYGIKGARGAEVSAPSRKIKISNATLQSNLVSTEHFSPAEIKSARFRGALTHEITEGQQTRWQRAHSNTLPSHFFNYQAGENSGGRSECLQLSFYFISQ